MLSIQKVVVLLEEYHLDEFRSYLKKTNAELPLKLVDAVHKKGWEEADSDDLCKVIYKKAGAPEKRKFFQLAHHTFKLTGFLSRNYPSYLQHNVSKVELLVNQGKLKEANALSEILLDISEKTEDFSTARAVLQFFAQQSYIREKKTEAIRYLESNARVIDSERALNDLYLYLRTNLHFKDKTTGDNLDTEKHLSYFRSFQQHTSFAVRILSRYAWCYTLHFLNDERFYTKEIQDELNFISDELEKAPYVIFSFADDVELNVDYLKLKLLVSWLEKDELQKVAANLLKKRETPRFWRNYLNSAQIGFISIQASLLASTYGFCYRKGWYETIPSELREEIAMYRKSCEEILASPTWEEESLYVRFINVNNIYCCFLLMSSLDDVKRVPPLIESLLFNYQQVAFHRMYDQIFATLIMAYFISEDYLKVQECYKRYEKLTANSSKLMENDLTIKAYYYAAQWISSGRKQYQEKMNGLLEKTNKAKNLENVRNLVVDIKDYFGF
ncbi:MAG TPA: hypothetical protein VK826_05015 [Bacteroidia bacterium]|nr:hypothetical protein [Bacteroidia bacterium]